MNCEFNVRVTGILVENGEILLVKQHISKKREWSLPGGRVGCGETLNDAIIREMKEETGLIVHCIKLLYVCEKLDANPAILHITFLLKKVSDEIILPTNEFDENPISDVKFVDLNKLNEYGFSEKFIDLVKNDFPASGSYMGDKRNIGL